MFLREIKAIFFVERQECYLKYEARQRSWRSLGWNGWYELMSLTLSLGCAAAQEQPFFFFAQEQYLKIWSNFSLAFPQRIQKGSVIIH